MQKNHFIKIRELIAVRELVTKDVYPDEAGYELMSKDAFKEEYDYTYINLTTVREIRYVGNQFINLSYDDRELFPYQIRTIDGGKYLTSKFFVKDLLKE